ncbi:MAG: hypothetical protein LPK00_10570 [Bacillaceae bacterium]|nr:hypothetical protein [Bacillaceae bacterium]
MKRKIIFSFLLVLLLIIITVATFYKINYKNLDEAIKESNIEMADIFQITEYKGHTIIIYGNDDLLSVGLIERTLLGYRWGYGFGSKQFNEEDRMLTRAFSNLNPKEIKSDHELVSLTFGVINDPSIEEILIKYKDKDFTEATIIETSKGRIWYCFSEDPVNYDPDVKLVFKDGTTKYGWY